MRYLLLLWLLQCLTLDAHSQAVLRFWTLSSEQSSVGSVAGKLYGDAGCEPATLFVEEPFEQPESPPTRVDNFTTPDFRGSTKQAIFGAAVEAIFEACNRQADVLRVFDASPEQRPSSMREGFRKWTNVRLLSLPMLMEEVDGSATFQPQQLRSQGDLTKSLLIADGDLFSSMQSFRSELRTEKLKTGKVKNSTLAKGKPLANAALPMVTAVCSPAGFDRNSISATLAAIRLYEICFRGADSLDWYGLSAAESKQYLASFGPLVEAHLPLQRYLREMPPEQEVLLVQHISTLRDVSFDSRDLDHLRWREVGRLRGILLDYIEFREREWAQIEAVSDAEQEARWAEETRAAMERELEKSDKAKSERLRQLTTIPGGPTGEDIAKAIIAEHVAAGYAAYGKFGVVLEVPSMLGVATVDSFEVDVSQPICKPAGNEEYYSCTYEFTRQNTTIARDQSGVMARGQAAVLIFSGLSGGVDPYNYTLQTTDIFKREGGAWKSPSWADWIKELSSREIKGTSKEKCKKEYQFSDNGLVGFYATPSAFCEP